MKKEGIIIALFMVIVAIAAAFYYFSYQQAPKKVAEAFFDAIKKKDMSKIESFLSEDFRKNFSKEELLDYLVLNNFFDYKKIQLDRVDSIKGYKVVKGVMHNQDNSSSKIAVFEKKEKGKWKIASLEKKLNPKEVVRKAKLLQIKAFYMQLARKNLHNLAKAIAENNMSNFYHSIAKVWQKKTSPKKLETIFAPFIKKKVNLLALDKVKPILTKIAINKNKILEINGFYKIANSKNRFYFEEKFIKEQKKWALIGIAIAIK